MLSATVVGSGVIGLTSALVLLERGHRVRIVAREFAWRTTSAVAAAIWFPYDARPRARVHAWASRSLHCFAALARTVGTGVVPTHGVAYTRAGAPECWWREIVPQWEALPKAMLPNGVVAGDRLVVPVVEMPIHLQFLVGEVQRLGGRFEQRDVHDLAQVDGEVLVHCTGLGARRLANDAAVQPVRGQIVRTARLVGEFVIDDDNPGGVTYVVPRAHDCVLGGTSEPGDADLAERPEQSRAILARCAALQPALAGAVPQSVAVGARPGRATVRLERETLPDGRTVVHNYGHGGAGVTLSWGCAEEAADLLVDA